MRTHHRLTLVLLVGAAVLAGCSDDPAPVPGSDEHATIDPLDPQAMTADQVAATAMKTVLSWKPAQDRSKSDALHRARPWLGGRLLDVLDTDPGTASGVRPDTRWASWATAGDVLSAACLRADSTPAAPDGMRTVVIDVTCTQTVLHPDNQITALASETWRTTLTHTDAGWRLTDFRYR